MRRTVHSTCIRFTSAMSRFRLKKRRLSLSRKGRFKTVSEDQLTAMSKPSVPNTEKSSKWAIKNLKEWYEDYNSGMCPEDILSHTCSKEVLDKWLCVFINETQYTDMISSRIWLLSTSACLSLFKWPSRRYRTFKLIAGLICNLNQCI